MDGVEFRLKGVLARATDGLATSRASSYLRVRPLECRLTCGIAASCSMGEG